MVRGQSVRGGALHRSQAADDSEDEEADEEAAAAAAVAVKEEQQELSGGGGDGGGGDLAQAEDAVAALTAMKYSPVVPGLLGAGAGAGSPALLPIPASLGGGQLGSAEPDEHAGWGGAQAAGPHRLHRGSGASAAAAAAAAGVGQADDSDLSGWRFCAVCGVRLDASWPLAAWHMQQHLQARSAAEALAAHARRARTPPGRRSPAGLCGGLGEVQAQHPPKNP